MRKKYPSDISRAAFEENVRPILAKAKKTTKPATLDLYEVFCAVLYVLKSGCQWRMLPEGFPKWESCYAYFAKWSVKRQETGCSLLEEALKKCGWRGPAKPWPQRDHQFSDC
jgi:transposase